MSSKSIGKISKVRIGTKKVSIVLDNNQRIEVSYQVYKSLNFKEGQILQESDLSHINEIKLGEKLFSCALKLVTTTPISINELSKRLSKKGGTTSQIKDIISNLDQEGLIDEEEIIYEFVEHYHNKFYGINRIKKLLIDKGFNVETVKRIEIDENVEQELANILVKNVEKKFRNNNYSSLKEKCYRKLIYNGFSFDVANKAIKLLDDKLLDNELKQLRIDLKKAKMKYLNKCSSKSYASNVIKYLLSKGYRFSDIEKIKGEIQDEMD